MKLQSISVEKNAPSKIVSVALALAVSATAIGNDGKLPSTDIRENAPVNYYQAFMIGLIAIYGIYLIVRARRRKRNSKITE